MAINIVSMALFTFSFIFSCICRVYTYYTVAEIQEGTLWNNSIPMLSEDQVEKIRKP